MFSYNRKIAILANTSMAFSSISYHSDSATPIEDLKLVEGFGLFEPYPAKTDPITCISYGMQMCLEVDYPSETNTEPEREELKEDESSKSSHSKDCLKFCRRISARALEDLACKSKLVSEVIHYNTELLKEFLRILRFEELDNSLVLDAIQFYCLRELWSAFKDEMSYSKNKKVCIVKITQWNVIFDRKVSTARIKDLCIKRADSCEDSQLRAILKDETFREIFARMLFCTNSTLTLVSILQDTSPKGETLRRMETIGNFLVLALYPQYFPFYNHRSGKFALECCGKCKVCHCKAIPSDFLRLLKQARQETDFFISQIKKLCSFSKATNFASVLMEFTYNYF